MIFIRISFTSVVICSFIRLFTTMPRQIIKLVILSFSLFYFFSCTSKNESPNPDALFQLLPSSQTGINFNNKVTDTKDFNIFKYRNFYNGGGVAIGDVNNDGKPDIF